MKNLFWFLKKGLLAGIILAVLYAAALYLVRRPCDNLFPPLDRSYDFTLELGGRTLQGNTGSKLDYLLLYLTKLAPDGLNFSVDFYGGTYQGNSGGLIDNFILMDGAFEKSVLYFMRDVMQVLAPGNGVFMDIGANTGQHSLYMAQYSREVHAFEPYEPVLKRFRHMIEINGLENIVVHAVGLGEADEKLPFFEPPAENPGTGSFVDGFKNYNTFTSAEFRIVRGDDWLAGIGQPVVHLIKLDVEGYEQPVLKGLRETLVRHRPVIVVEISFGNTLSFQSKEELLSVLPPDYAYLEMPMALSGWCRGLYELVDYEEEFGESGMQVHLVLFPGELRDRIPTSSCSDGT